MSFKGKLRSVCFINFKDSICNKFFNKIFLYYIFLSLILFFSGLSIIYSLDLEIYLSLFYKIFLTYFILILVSFLIIIRLIFRNLILKRLRLIKRELDSIKNENFKYRVRYNSYDEIDQIAALTNEILDKYENLYNTEKRNAILDPLTKCYNRRALELEFEALKEKIKREKKRASFLIFDIDDFKKINDTYGHKMGDCVLIELSKTVKNLIRKYDNIYRIGGEEFLVIFYNLKKKEVPNILDRILKKIPYSIKKNSPELNKEVTISGGFVNVNFKEIEKINLNEIIEKADKLLYEAKKAGKNQIKSEK